jgi:spermidine/putrescine-binding protein
MQGRASRYPAARSTLPAGHHRDWLAQRQGNAPLTSWQALLAPDASLKGRIMMFDDAIELTSIALKSIGKSMTESNDSALRMAEAILVAQKPYPGRYGYETISGDARLVEGSIDYVMIMENSPHRKEAHAFPDYLYRPEVAARLSNDLMFATPNDAATTLQPASIKDHKAIYPDPETLSRSKVLKPFSDPQVARRNAIADQLVK